MTAPVREAAGDGDGGTGPDDCYDRSVTLAFVYMSFLLLGAILAVVTGLVRRILHPEELCRHVVSPSHDHWAAIHTPWTDIVVSFVMVFGGATLLLHALLTMPPAREIVWGVLIGAIGSVVLRLWLGRVECPPELVPQCDEQAEVTREIPPHGFGQVEVKVGERRVRLAARSQDDRPIPSGTMVCILDRGESVVVVSIAR